MAMEIEYLRQQLAERNTELKRINHAINDDRVDLTITAAESIIELRQQLTNSIVINTTKAPESSIELVKLLRANAESLLCQQAADEIEGLHTELRHQLDAKEAEVDALMLEYCPSEMSQAQLDNWAAHQRPIEEQGK